MSWVDQYSAALARRDICELASKPLYDAYTRLADHSASPDTSHPPAVAVASQVDNTSNIRLSGPETPGTQSSPAPTSDVIATLRTDLAAAQSTRVSLTTELGTLNTTLASLQSTLTATSMTANSLAREKAVLERKLRDRDEELREKSRLLDRVQDEVVALEMQLNLLEEERSMRQEKR